MANLCVVFCLLATVLLQRGNSLEVQRVKLVGGREDYINVASKTEYMLSCSYRSGYDNPVERVVWYLHGSPVYEWLANKNDITVSGVLLGRVDSTPRDEPSNLHFTRLDYYIAGNYTCKVFSASKTSEKTFYLYVIDIARAPYHTNITILKDMLEEQRGTLEDPKYITYDVESPQPTAVVPEEEEVEFEDAQCTLVWSFSSPAIFPKPNVTCGYYSFDHDDVVHYLPAGLTLHKFMNGSWQASFDATHVQVTDIPVNHRLGCSVRVPGTTYREMVMMEDNFAIDALIDSAGCPDLDYLMEEKGMNVEKRNATTNCRGQVLPSVREGPAIITLSCPYGQWAHFEDGNKEPRWYMQVSCYEYEHQWRSYHLGDSKKQGELINLDDIPMCDSAVGASQGVSGSVLLTSLFILSFLFTLQEH